MVLFRDGQGPEGSFVSTAKTLPCTTYFQHRRLYYNKDTGERLSSTINRHSDSEDSASLDEPFCFSDEESGSMVDTHQWQESSQEGKVLLLHKQHT